VEHKDGQHPSPDHGPSSLRDESWQPIRVLLPRSRLELFEQLLNGGAGLLAIVTALAPFRGISLATIGLLGAAAGLLTLAGAIVGALRPETTLVDGLVIDRPGVHTLPGSPAKFVGRRIRIAQALRYLRRRENESRVLAISGMPGVGKTSLAKVIAGQLSRTSYPDNQLYIHLGGGPQAARKSMAVLYEALVQLRVPANEISNNLEGRRNRYLQALHGTRSLVVLDDASEAEQVTDLWPPDGCAAIVTCRVELLQAIAKGARPMRLRPLGTSQALRFLANRIGPWRVARQPLAALRLVRLYGRLPLALECVSARLAITSGRRLPLRAVLGRLQDRRLRLAFASVGADYSVALALDVSYRGLIEEQQRAFCVFGLLDLPELDEEVVAAVLQTTPERARKLLSQVTAAGLLEVAGRSGERWTAHELARLYASVIVSDLPQEERREAIRRAVEVYLRRVRTLKELLASPVAQLDPELAAAARAQMEADLAQQRQLVLALLGQATRFGIDLGTSVAGELLSLLLGIITDWPDPAPPDEDGDPARRLGSSLPSSHPSAHDRPPAPPDKDRELRPPRQKAPHQSREPEHASWGSPGLPGGAGPSNGQSRGGSQEPPPPPPPPVGDTNRRPEPPTRPPTGPNQSTPPPAGAEPPPGSRPQREPPSGQSEGARQSEARTGREDPGGLPGSAAPPPGHPDPSEGSGSSGSAPHPTDPNGPPPRPSTGDPYASNRAAPQAVVPVSPRQRRRRAPTTEPSAAGSIFVGRDAELEALQAALCGSHGADDARPALALISGAPAVGRWSLARRLARQLTDAYPDGYLVVDLSPVGGQEPTTVDTLASLLTAQGHSPKQVAAMRPADLQHRYRAWFEGKRALVLIRNARSSAQIAPFLPDQASSAAIITSRSEIRDLTPTVHCHLGPLSEADAVQLLARSSQREDVEADSASVWLAHWYGCHPLFLRCVGAWMGTAARRNLPVASLAEVLIDRGPPVTPDMDRELLRRLHRCVQLIPSATTKVYRLITLLDAHDVDVGVVAALANIPPAEAKAALSRLADAGLLERIDSDIERFRLDPLLRRLPASRPQAPWSLLEARKALTRAFEHYVEQLDPPGITDATRAPDSTAWFERNRLNLSAALFQASRLRLTHHACALAFTMTKFCATRGYPSAWHVTAEVGLLAARRLRDPGALSRAYANLAEAQLQLGQVEDALKSYQDAHEALARRPNHGVGLEARVFAGLALAYHRNGVPTQAIHYSKRSLGLCRKLPVTYDPGPIARLLHELASAHEAAGQFTHAANAYAASGRLYRRLGDLEATEAALRGHLSALDQALGTNGRDEQKPKVRVLRELGAIQQRLGYEAQAAATLRQLGDLYDTLGYGQDAAAALRQSGELFLRVHDLRRAASAFEESAWLYRAISDHELAATMLRTTSGIYRKLGDRAEQARVSLDLGEAYLRLGHVWRAAAVLRMSSRLYDDLGDREHEAHALRRMGTAHQNLGDNLMAAHSLWVSAQLFEDVGQFQEATMTFYDSGKLYRARNEYEEAVAAFSSSQRLNNMRGCQLTPADEIELADALAELHHDLGDPAREATALIHVGDVGEQHGQLAQAAKAFGRGGDLLVSLHDTGQATVAYSRAANANWKAGAQDLAAGRPENAATSLQSAADLFQRLSDRSREAEVQQALGQAWLKLGAPERAASASQRSVDLYQELGTATTDVANAYIQLGQALQESEQFNQAAAAFRTGGEQFGQLRRHDRAARAHQQSAELFDYMGRPGEAAVEFHAAGHHGKLTGQPDELPAARQNLIEALHRVDDPASQLADMVRVELDEVSTALEPPAPKVDRFLVEDISTISMFGPYTRVEGPAEPYIDPYRDGPAGPIAGRF
jgi:tetratricopeptide (TPR) repeat protein